MSAKILINFNLQGSIQSESWFYWNLFANFKYENLKLTFKDGYVSEYTCTNFEDEAANKEYVRENLLFPHNTLPLGEFAIGTNTLAYVIAEKYGIVDKLPVLIIEKMGPHFAIGDTCFSWVEDMPVYNMLDKKEIVARDNEKSILRKIKIKYQVLKELREKRYIVKKYLKIGAEFRS